MAINKESMEQIEDSNRKVYDFMQSGNLLCGRWMREDG